MFGDGSIGRREDYAFTFSSTLSLRARTGGHHGRTHGQQSCIPIFFLDDDGGMMDGFGGGEAKS